MNFHLKLIKIKKTGIVIRNASILSNIPPCPGINLPESFTLATLL